MIESKPLVDLWNFKFLHMYWKCWNDSGKECIINSKDEMKIIRDEFALDTYIFVRLYMITDKNNMKEYGRSELMSFAILNNQCKRQFPRLRFCLPIMTFTEYPDVEFAIYHWYCDRKYFIDLYESDVYIKKVLDDIDIPFFDKTRYL